MEETENESLSWKRQMCELEQKVRLLSESNKERMERIEEKMDAFGSRVVEIAKINSENRRRITEMEASTHQQEVAC